MLRQDQLTAAAAHQNIFGERYLLKNTETNKIVIMISVKLCMYFVKNYFLVLHFKIDNI